MTLTQREHPEAVAEFDDAVRWYEAQEPESRALDRVPADSVANSVSGGVVRPRQ